MSAPTVAELKAKLAYVAERRPMIGVPYTYEYQGEPWTIACDGWCLLALRGERGAEPWAQGAPVFAGVIDPVPTEGWRPLDAGALIAWANAAAPDPATCPHCDGKGTRLANKCETCDGTGVYYCTCPDCDDEHEADCQDCHGKPQTDVPCGRCDEPREAKGWFGKAMVNRANVWRWLSWLPADAPVEAVAPEAERAVRFRGPDWFALVMPMRHVDEPHTAGVFDGWLAGALPSRETTP